MGYLLIGLDAVLCVVFGVSAWSKLVAHPAFAASLRPLRLVPDRLVRPTAVVLTAVELAVALGFGWAVLTGIGPGPAGDAVDAASLIVAGLLLAVLTTGIAVELRRGSRATCACFGAAERPLGRRHLVRNGFLITVALTGLAIHASGEDRATEIAGGVVSLVAGAVVALILIRLDDLVELLVPMKSPEPGSPTRS